MLHCVKGMMQMYFCCICMFVVFVFLLYLYCRKSVKLGDCCGTFLAMAMGHASRNFFAERCLIYFVWSGMPVKKVLLCMTWKSLVWSSMAVLFARGATDAAG